MCGRFGAIDFRARFLKAKTKISIRIVLTRKKAYIHLNTARCWHCNQSRCSYAVLANDRERQMNNKQ